MRNRSQKAFWPVILLILAVGYFVRGRASSTAVPTPDVSSPASPMAEKPVGSTTQPPVQISTSAVQTDQRKATTVHQRDKKQLRLRVVGVHDGDTITGLDEDRVQHKIRLDAIDAPELGQPFGQASKKALSEKVFGKDVVVTVKTRDKYGRTVGHVLIDGRDVSLEMLEEGMAWHYEKYDNNKRLWEAERSARAARMGLWADGNAEPPWEWRADKRGSKATQAMTDEL